MTRMCSSRARQQRGGSRVQRASREPVRVTPQSRPRRRAPVVSRALGWAPLTLFNLHVTLWDGGRYSVYSQLRHREPERLVQDQISAKATIQGQSSPTAKPLLISPPALDCVFSHRALLPCIDILLFGMGEQDSTTVFWFNSKANPSWNFVGGSSGKHCTS